MTEIYLTLADGFEKLAVAYRALACSKAGSEGDSKEEGFVQSLEPEPKENPQIGIETVRAVLAEKSREGKIREIKTLLKKYDGEKLSGVKPEDYARLLAEAEVL